MVDAVVSFAIEKLGEFIAQEVNILTGVNDGVRWLKDELGYLQAVARDAELRQEELIRKWVNNIRDVASDAVTILSDFNALQQEHAAPKQGILDRFRGCVCMFKKEVVLLDIGKDIESLKERIVVIKNRRIEYGIDNILATPNVQLKQRTLLRTTAIDNQVDVVGFEDDIKTLMAELNSENLSLRVISIHGMGGLGKTSLATKLYNSSELKHFDARAKERGRYLVLIDDIWDIKVWDQIKIAFPNQKNGSRIIITTRNKKIATMVDDKGFVHQLRFLTEDESWQLFCKRAEPSTENMERLGKEMVGKCRGLPLAILVLSGLLLHNKSYGYWSKVKEHIWRQLKEVGSFQIEEILSLSYIDLSPQIRDCFLYLARYPEDHVIDSDELKLLWIAEEFISEADEGEGVVMEDLAEDYLNELINSNLIQVESLRLNGQVSSCRVHDLVLNLAVNKAKEHKLLVVFNSGKQHPDLIQLLEGQQRHVIYNGIGEYLKLLEGRFDASSAQVKYFKDELNEMKLMYTRFKNLKVLDMRTVYSATVPDEIGDFVLLKYLGLMGGGTEPIEIPPSIGKLKKLQTLLGSEERLYTVPREISELHELRYLNLRISGSLNIGNHQTKLHTLGFLHHKEWIKIDTVSSTNLRTLLIGDNQVEIMDETAHKEEIIKRDDYTLDLESIANLTSLQTLSISFCNAVIPTMKPFSSCNCLKSVDLMCALNDPSKLCFLPDSVTDLRLVYSNFTQDPMPTLASLSNLTGLESVGAYMGNKMVCGHDAFPCLQILRLYEFYHLEELQVEDGAFPSLKQYQSEHYPNLKIPVQLERCWIQVNYVTVIF